MKLKLRLAFYFCLFVILSFSEIVPKVAVFLRDQVMIVVLVVQRMVE